MGWQGRVLRVDLTAGRCVGEPLNVDWARAYLGQRGLATKYLFEEIDPACDPLSPGNALIIATGPLTGTSAPTGGRSSAVCKSPLTGAIACSNTGGQFGAEVKMAGWDLIIVHGRAETPVVLSIVDQEAHLLPAGDLWGRSVWEAEPALRDRLGDPQTKIASIGRAGENGVLYACIVNDMDRAFGRSGVGAVMGSKNLKAIAVRGTRGVGVADPAAFTRAVAAAQAKLADHPVKQRFEAYGTMPMMNVTHNYGSLPTRNCRDVQFEGIASVDARRMRSRRETDGKPNLIANKGCFACTIGCGRVSKIDPTHFAVAGEDKRRYLKASGGLEYESGFAFAPMCGVADQEAGTYANFVCNEDGMDPISFGVTIAAAMELFEEGALTLADTGGIELHFGNAGALVAVSDLMGTGEGFARDIGLGAKRLCAKYGRPELAMVVKGQEFPGYDPRAMQGMGLAYATSNRGACHMKARPYMDDFKRVATDGKAKVVKDTQDWVAAVDSAGLCAFPMNCWTLDDVAPMIEAALGGGWTVARLNETGERIFNLERLFNLRAGLTAADDTLPRRSLEDPARSGAGQGRVCGLPEMLPEYYALRGWGPDGVPSGATRARLEIE